MSQSNTTTTSATVLTARNRSLALAAMCGSLAIAMLDLTAVNVALPSIQRTFHTTTVTIQWVVNAYTLALAVFLITCGRLGDVFGRRKMFLAGVTIFSVASIAIGVSPSTAWMLAWRAVQGTGAALMLPATIAIITDLFKPEERGQAIGIWTGVSGIALALGPVAGGFLATSVSWRLIFFLNVPIAVAALIATVLVVPESRDKSVTRSIDIAGVITLSIGLFALTFGIVKVISWHFGSVRVLGLFATGLIALFAFVWVERHSKAPMLEFKLFQTREFLSSVMVVFILMFLLFGTQLFISLYLQNIRNYSPLQAGLRFMPSMGALIIASPIAGRLTDRIGARPVVCLGLVMIGIASLVASLVTVTSSYTVLLIGLVLLGFGMGLALPATSTAGINAVPEAKAGVASGILSTARMVGGVFGVVLLGLLMLALASHKLQQLAPFLPHGAALQLANKPPTRAEQALAPAEFILHVRQSFVFALQYMLRVAAFLPLVGAALTWFLMGPRRQASHEAVLESVSTSDPSRGVVSQPAALAVSDPDH